MMSEPARQDDGDREAADGSSDHWLALPVSFGMEEAVLAAIIAGLLVWLA